MDANLADQSFPVYSSATKNQTRRSHSGVSENAGFLDKWFLMFWKNEVPLSSRGKQSKKNRRWQYMFLYNIKKH